ncbi:MAG: hypothetical protein V1711_02270 [bacterium]
MNIKKLVKNMFAKREKPEKKLSVLKPELKQLRENLQRMSRTHDPLTEIVPFFDTVSKWHDRGIYDIILAFEEVNRRGKYDEVLKKLEILQVHFKNAGRCEFGWNRTKPGETVRADRVFLGNIYGLFTHSVSFWRRGKDEKKGGWGFSGMEHLNPYDVVSKQAKEFMDGHIGPMIAILKELEAIAA